MLHNGTQLTATTTTSLFQQLWMAEEDSHYIWLGPGKDLGKVVKKLEPGKIYSLESATHSMLIQRAPDNKITLFDPSSGMSQSSDFKTAYPWLIKALRMDDYETFENLLRPDDLPALSAKREAIGSPLLCEACQFGASHVVQYLIEVQGMLIKRFASVPIRPGF